jgi:hypothetical protein
VGWACGAALGVARIVWGRRCVGDRSVGGSLVGWVLGFCGGLGKLTPSSPATFAESILCKMELRNIHKMSVAKVVSVQLIVITRF